MHALLIPRGRSGLLPLAVWMVLQGPWQAAQAQTRPDSGSLQETPRALPGMPGPGGPKPILPTPQPPAGTKAAITIRPTGFLVRGSTVFEGQMLAGLLAKRVDKPTDLDGLQEAANTIKAYYTERGYLLTDVYIPEQVLRTEGAPVTLVVVEARIGSVTVRTADPRVSADIAYRIAVKNLPRGAAITEDLLDRPVLLLRDLSGYEATATVQPGSAPGESNVVIDVKSSLPPLTASIGADNHGTRAAGTYRAFVTADLNNVSGRGDALQARAQVTDIKETRLFKLSYALTVGDASRLQLQASRSEYGLGAQFAALQARGYANVWGASILTPLLRTRLRNHYASLAFERKTLGDETAIGAPSLRTVHTLRTGLLGNLALGTGGSSLLSFAGNVTWGHVRMDDAALAQDQGATGLMTAGRFWKLNVEAQHSAPLGERLSLQTAFQSQWASRNLTSSEKMSLGGPSSVRGYPAGEASGDSGAVLSTELRYQLAPSLNVAGEPLQISGFYDIGTTRTNQRPLDASSNRVTLDSAGLGLSAGRYGNFQVNAALAWRIGLPLPASGESDRTPRLWITSQKWF